MRHSAVLLDLYFTPINCLIIFKQSTFSIKTVVHRLVPILFLIFTRHFLFRSCCYFPNLVRGSAVILLQYAVRLSVHLSFTSHYSPFLYLRCWKSIIGSPKCRSVFLEYVTFPISFCSVLRMEVECLWLNGSHRHFVIGASPLLLQFPVYMQTNFSFILVARYLTSIKWYLQIRHSEGNNLR